MGGLGLGLFMSFTMRVNAATALIYSGFEGVLLGAISHVFEQRWPGIVVQAVTGTVMVAAGMLFVYKIGAIRVTPKFTRVVVGATIGVFGLMVVNLIAYLFTPNGLGLRSGGPIAIIFSLVCIVIAAFNLVLDFDMVERASARRAAEVRLVRRVRADRHADLALHRDPAPARLRAPVAAAPAYNAGHTKGRA